jgi:hypothetical protein
MSTNQEQRRGEQRASLAAALDKLKPRLDKARRDLKQAALLKSVTTGLYDEIDKLAKKAPVEQVTKLVVEQVNQVIEEIRTLAAEDPYVQRIKPFVPAGDNPEHRDVVVVLRQLLQGLDRCNEALRELEKSTAGKVKTAGGLLFAVEFFLEHGESPTKEDFDANDVTWLSSRWVTDSPYDEDGKSVRLELVDELDVEGYFGPDA